MYKSGCTNSGIHDFLDLLRFDGNIFHQVENPVFFNYNIIFDPDPQALVTDVNSRLNSPNLAYLHFVVHVSHIVNVQSQLMSRAVHKILEEERLVLILFLNILFVD